jgi:hypothetical protein
MNTAYPPEGDTPFDRPDMQDLLRRFTILEQNQRDMLYLLRTLRPALYHPRARLSPETRRIHREVIRMDPYNGACPCCLETKVVSDAGAVIAPADFDHFWGRIYNAPVHSWLICKPCHQALSNDPHLAWYHRLTTRFRRYQAAAQAYTAAFGHRTATRIHTGHRTD